MRALNGVRGRRPRAAGRPPRRSGSRFAADVEHRAERTAQAVAHLVGRRHQRPGCGWPGRARGRSGRPARGRGPACGRGSTPARSSTSPSLGTGSGVPLLVGRLDRVALRVGVEHQREQLGARRAVDGGVVDLGQDGEAVVGQALDDVGLPQRAAAIERAADDAGDELGELARRCPGGATAVWRTWKSRSKSGSSIQNGWSRPNGHLPQAPPQRLEQVQAPLDLRPPRRRAARSPGRPGGRRSRGSTRGRTATRSPCRGTRRPDR